MLVVVMQENHKLKLKRQIKKERKKVNKTCNIEHMTTGLLELMLVVRAEERNNKINGLTNQLGYLRFENNDNDQYLKVL